jgi:GT2 family glycosyltransferase
VTRRIRIDGKQFELDGARFRFRGVTYGTFAARGDGEPYPERARVKLDFTGIADAGFTVVRTYTPPPDDLVELAADWDLHLLAGVHPLDWRYAFGASRRQWARLARDYIALARAGARRLAGAEPVFALAIGNEIPADVVRWVGVRRVERVLAAAAEAVREEDDQQLVTYGTYPSTEYLATPTLDFVTCNVFLEQSGDFSAYVARLQHVAGDRPLVLGELGLHVNTRADEGRQAALIEDQLRIAVERGAAGTCIFSWTDEWSVGGDPVTGWRFGLTDSARNPRPSLAVSTRSNARDVTDLRAVWPGISVVICAYNADATLDECLLHTTQLRYPQLEIIVVDDGSQDATADVAARYEGVRLIRLRHGGLSAARNAGAAAAYHHLIAYLDADAFPAPEWLHYLALDFERGVAASGGPNVPPRDEPYGAQRVAAAPGGPRHVMLDDERAEHLPGCNLAVRREVLDAIGGFDVRYETAGDDVDLCFRILDAGHEIGFHPGALVWHRRRSTTRAFLRQQRGYGRAEALVAERHPERCTADRAPRFHGRVYASVRPAGRVYRGPYGAAAFQSIYGGGDDLIDAAHHVGVPTAAALGFAGLLCGFLVPVMRLFAFAAICALLALGLVDYRRCLPRRGHGRDRRHRASVAALWLLQPIARMWGRLRGGGAASDDDGLGSGLRPARTVGRSVVIAGGDRVDVVRAAMRRLRRVGLVAAPASPWADHDAAFDASLAVRAHLVSSAYPEGFVQLRVRRRMRPAGFAIACLALAIALIAPPLVLPVALICAVDVGIGYWRSGPRARRVLMEGAHS